MSSTISDQRFADLLRFRTELRRFERWSEAQALAVDLTHMQHQVLLAVRGHSDPRGPTVKDVADYLLLRHHSAGELIDRVAMLGHVRRIPDPDDGRAVRIRLTARGTAKLRDLSALHLEELRRLGPVLSGLVRGLDRRLRR